MEKKQFKFVEPDVSRKEMIDVLVKGLERPLTEQEVKIIHWLGDSDYEARGVLLDLFKELNSKIEFYKKEEPESKFYKASDGHSFIK
jgi:hypothetical protein